MFKNTRERTRAVLYDSDNFRWVLDLPKNESVTADVPYVFRSVVGMTNMTWKKMAQFSGLKSASDAFVTAYRSRPVRELKFLNEYLVIDDAEKKVYFYHKDHKPEGVIEEHVGPEIVNPVTELTVRTKVPTRALSRMSINAPDHQLLTLSITPVGGYLFDEFDVRLAISNMTHVVSGSTRNLNKLLKTIFFIATEAGSGEVVVKVDDNSGQSGGVTSTSLRLTIEETKTPSIPTMEVPATGTGTIGKLSTVSAVTVADTDNKFMQVKVQPFGCAVMNFKGRLIPVEPGQFHIVYGTPTGINEELAELQVKPYQESCSLGFELKCETTVIRKYMSITATAPTEDTETDAEGKEEEAGGDATAATPTEPPAGTGASDAAEKSDVKGTSEQSAAAANVTETPAGPQQNAVDTASAASTAATPKAAPAATKTATPTVKIISRAATPAASTEE